MHTITITDWDNGGNTNVATATINMKNGKNYRIKVRLGGVIYIGLSGVSRDGLVAEYLFSGNALDTSGNGNNPTNVTARFTNDRFGILDRAYDFNVGYITVPHSESLNPKTAMTISCFAKMDSYPDGYANCLIRKAYSMDAGYLLIYEKNQILLKLDGPRLMNSVYLKYSIPSDKVLLGNWRHIAASYDSVTKIGKIYFDGQLVLTTNVNYSFTNTGRFMTIGHGYYDGARVFPGCIDDIRIYNRALSDDEVLALYNDN